jgi:hypothetical protein
MTPSDQNYTLLRQMDQVSQDLGFGKVDALDPGSRGAGDIAFVSHLIRDWMVSAPVVVAHTLPVNSPTWNPCQR